MKGIWVLLDLLEPFGPFVWLILASQHGLRDPSEMNSFPHLTPQTPDVEGL